MSGFEEWFREIFDPEAAAHQQQLHGMEATAEAMERQRVFFEEVRMDHLWKLFQMIDECARQEEPQDALRSLHMLHGILSGVIAARQYFRNDGVSLDEEAPGGEGS